MITQLHYLLCHTLVHFLQGCVSESPCASLGWLPGRTPRSFPGWKGHPGRDRFGHGCHWATEKPSGSSPGPSSSSICQSLSGRETTEGRTMQGVGVEWDSQWLCSLSSRAWFQSTEMAETVRQNLKYTTTLHSLKGKGQQTTGVQGTCFKNLWCFQRNPRWQSISLSTSFIQEEQMQLLCPWCPANSVWIGTVCTNRTVWQNKDLNHYQITRLFFFQLS